MLVSLLAGLALVGGAHAAPSPSMDAPAAFSLVLESTATGWAARCDSGCRWQRLSFDCERSCAAVIDANGVSRAGTVGEERAAFRFRVERTEQGVRATSAAGTAWVALAWSCASGSCRARVDGYGVSGLDQAR